MVHTSFQVSCRNQSLEPAWLLPRICISNKSKSGSGVRAGNPTAVQNCNIGSKYLTQEVKCVPRSLLLVVGIYSSNPFSFLTSSTLITECIISLGAGGNGNQDRGQAEPFPMCASFTLKGRPSPSLFIPGPLHPFMSSHFNAAS